MLRCVSQGARLRLAGTAVDSMVVALRSTAAAAIAAAVLVLGGNLAAARPVPDGVQDPDRVLEAVRVANTGAGRAVALLESRADAAGDIDRLDAAEFRDGRWQPQQRVWERRDGSAPGGAGISAPTHVVGLGGGRALAVWTEVLVDRQARVHDQTYSSFFDGHRWQPSVTLEPIVEPKSLGVVGAGHAAIVFWCEHGTGPAGAFKAARISGPRLSTVRLFAHARGSCNHPQATLTSAGSGIAVWESQDEACTSRFLGQVYLCSLIHAHSFGTASSAEAVTISSTGSENGAHRPIVTGFRDGRAVALWFNSLQLMTASFDGVSWSTPSVLEGRPFRIGDYHLVPGTEPAVAYVHRLDPREHRRPPPPAERLPRAAVFDGNRWTLPTDLFESSSYRTVSHLGAHGLVVFTQRRPEDVRARLLVARPTASGWSQPAPITPWGVRSPQVTELRPGLALVTWVSGSVVRTRLRFAVVRYTPRDFALAVSPPSITPVEPRTTG